MTVTVTIGGAPGDKATGTAAGRPQLRRHGEKTCPPVDKVVRRVCEISTLPHVALRLMKVANDEHSSAADLKAVMEGDAALSARVLRCVNSSAFAVRGKITNLQQAIAYLGMKQIRNLAMTASVSKMFAKDERIGYYCRSGVWRHLVSVGICARMLAMRLKFMNFEDMFLAGLLHDIGIVLEDQFAHEDFIRVVQSLNDKQMLTAAEQLHFSFDHTILGDRLAESWGFPEAVRAAIRYHHASVSYRGGETNLVRCVEVANLICTLKMISSMGQKLPVCSRPAFAELSLTKEDVVVLSADLDREFASNADLFQI
jgi:putative nucleotidyltransferase with HDIG domain